MDFNFNAAALRVEGRWKAAGVAQLGGVPVLLHTGADSSHKICLTLRQTFLPEPEAFQAYLPVHVLRSMPNTALQRHLLSTLFLPFLNVTFKNIVLVICKAHKTAPLLAQSCLLVLACSTLQAGCSLEGAQVWGAQILHDRDVLVLSGVSLLQELLEYRLAVLAFQLKAFCFCNPWQCKCKNTQYVML
eukprot:scaffold177652_cov19-Tisochrysis_lutea.AAC.1